MTKYYLTETQEAYDDLMKELEKQGYRWNGGGLPTSLKYSDAFRGNSVVIVPELNLESLTYGYKGWYINIEGATNFIKWQVGDKLGDDEMQNKYMTTEEFEKEINSLGYEIESSGYNIIVCVDGDGVVFVSKTHRFEIDTFNYEFSCLSDSEKDKLMDIVLRYARTPVAKREKRYKIKSNLKNYSNYINYDIKDKKCFLGDGLDTEDFKTIFTELEVDSMKEDIINNLEIIEVE